MNKSLPRFRIGNGYDIHRLVEDRDLIIGGVKLHHPESLGLDGHSDAALNYGCIVGSTFAGRHRKVFPPV